jgi:hypothetical protein
MDMRGRPAAKRCGYCDDGQLNLPSDGHAELPGGGQRDYFM